MAAARPWPALPFPGRDDAARAATVDRRAAGGLSATMADDSLIRLSASAAVDLLKRRQVSALELIDAALARIAAVNPRINAMVTLCPERARDQARRLMKAAPPDGGAPGGGRAR